MVESVYFFIEDPTAQIEYASSFISDKVDAFVVDTSGLSLAQMVHYFGNCEFNSKSDDSLIIFLYEDALIMARHLFMEVKKNGGKGLKFSPKLNFYVDVGARTELRKSGGMTSQIERVATVFSAKEIKRNETSNKNTYIEGERQKPLKRANKKKCVGGDIVSQILHRFDYDEWENVVVSNFENELLVKFSKLEPRSPTERFPFLVNVVDSNIRTINAEKMSCAVNDIFCNFDWCPDPSEITKMMKDLEESES